MGRIEYDNVIGADSFSLDHESTPLAIMNARIILVFLRELLFPLDHQLQFVYRTC
jgi:hypothetical protein